MIILKRPIITEKSMALANKGFYTFEVAKAATKPQIAKAVADKFNVKIEDIRTLNVKGEVRTQRRVRKLYTRSGVKKAIVRVGQGQKIAMFEAALAPEETVVTTAEGEPTIMREKKDLLGKTKVRVEKSAVGAAPTTQRKVITGK